MPVDRQRLKGLYARLKGIQRACEAERGPWCPETMGHDFNSIVDQAGQALEEDTRAFVVPTGAFVLMASKQVNCDKGELTNKLNQLVSYLEFTQHVGAEIVEIGSLYNSILDEELRARCADLLSAPGKFDRVVNQATLVLEDRIRAKTGRGNDRIGVQLVNEVLKTNLDETILKVSDDPGEHEGFCHICRGVMGAFRPHPSPARREYEQGGSPQSVRLH